MLQEKDELKYKINNKQKRTIIQSQHLLLSDIEVDKNIKRKKTRLKLGFQF